MILWYCPCLGTEAGPCPDRFVLTVPPGGDQRCPDCERRQRAIDREERVWLECMARTPLDPEDWT
jgi:hypothetical protein